MRAKRFRGLDAGTITLPLYKGQLTSGESVWYVLTDTTDEKNAAALGLNFSSKLVYADVGRGVRKASQQLIDGKTVVVFERAQYAFVVSGASAGRSGSRRRYRSPASAPRRSCA